MAVNAASGTGAIWLPREVSNMKLRSFISPGVTLNLEARVTQPSESKLSLAIESRLGERLIGSADVQFRPGTEP